MPKIRLFDVKLVSDVAEYAPGQTVNGQVELDLRETMTIKGLYVKVRGVTHVSWDEGMGDDKKSYSAGEINIDRLIKIIGNKNSNSILTNVEEGSHVYPFSFIIPFGIPSSFDGGTGHVRYWVKAVLERPHKKDRREKTFNVANPGLDLNSLPGTMNSVQAEGFITVCCCCCASDPSTARIKLDRTGYYTGDDIIIDSEVHERAERGVVKTEIKLLQYRWYSTGSSETCDVRMIAKLEHGPICPGNTDIFRGEKITIPPVPPTRFPFSKFIKFEYFVELTAVMAATVGDLKCKTQVIIGSKALQFSPPAYTPSETPQPMFVQTPDTSPAITDGVILQQPPAYTLPNHPPVAAFNEQGPDDTPPSYEEATNGSLLNTVIEDANNHHSAS